MRLVNRPWGWWLSLIKRPRFKVKLLYFKQGKKLSVQKHHLRSELWCFLSGRGTFLLKNDWLSVGAGDYRNVPPQTVHSFHAFKGTLVLEIQYGDKCIEDDIERLA